VINDIHQCKSAFNSYSYKSIDLPLVAQTASSESREGNGENVLPISSYCIGNCIRPLMAMVFLSYHKVDEVAMAAGGRQKGPK